MKSIAEIGARLCFGNRIPLLSAGRSPIRLRTVVWQRFDFSVGMREGRLPDRDQRSSAPGASSRSWEDDVARDLPFSIQLHSARLFPPVTDHLPRLAALGYTNVEPTETLYDDPSALRETLDESDLTALSGHFSLHMLETDPDAACRIAETLGMRLLVCPFAPVEARPVVTDEWRRFGDRLAAIARLLRSRGFGFAWHNHDYEFRPLRDGSMPIQHIAADPAVHLQVDVAWVALAGIDPQPWLEGYAGRIAAIHVKDIAPRGGRSGEDGWADIGAGIVPWPKLWKTAITAGASLLVAEHDNPSDFDRFARRSIDAMRAFAAMTKPEPSSPAR